MSLGRIMSIASCLQPKFTMLRLLLRLLIATSLLPVFDLSTAHEVNETVSVNWSIEAVVIAPDGYPRRAFSVIDKSKEHFQPNKIPGHDNRFDNKLILDRNEGGIHGPTLRVKTGQRVLVHVQNNLETETISIHWHGIHQKKQAWQDGVAGVTEWGIRPGGNTKTYNFTITQEPGTHWYHSHVAAQTMDGISGIIIIEGDSDTVKNDKNYKYDIDQILAVGDWSHEVSDDLAARYLSRIGPPSIGEEFFNLPDYPWPSYGILLNGRGQTDCTNISHDDCDKVREFGWPYFLGNTKTPYYGQKNCSEGHSEEINLTEGATESLITKSGCVLPKINGKLQKTYGQCMPQRPSLFGNCNSSKSPSDLTCQSGKSTRIRVANTGFSMPIRVWIDDHNFTVVAKDGVPVEPQGPHDILFINIGQRYDIIVKCDQNPEHNYKIFAMLALAEAMPGAQEINLQAYSYAVLNYGIKGANLKQESTPVEVMWPSAYAPEERPGHFYRDNYKSWAFDLNDYIPFAIERRMKPRSNSTYQIAPKVDSAPIMVAFDGNGNWWNNMSNSDSQIGLNEEYWGANTGGIWSESKSVLISKPAVPVLVSNFFGKPPFPHDSTSPHAPTKNPLIINMTYVPDNPKTYEVTIINFEKQQHPVHTHGFTFYVIKQGWLYPNRKWKTVNKAEPMPRETFTSDGQFYLNRTF